MEKEKNIQEELEVLSPLLAKMKKEQPTTGFSVPPAYFKNLADELIQQQEELQKVDREQKAVSSVMWWERLLNQVAEVFQPKLAMVFTIMLLLLAGTWFFNMNSNDKLQVNSEPTLEELENYVAANLDEFSEDLLLEYEIGMPVLDLDIEDENLDLLLEDIEIEDLL